MRTPFAQTMPGFAPTMPHFAQTMPRFTLTMPRFSPTMPRPVLARTPPCKGSIPLDAICTSCRIFSIRSNAVGTP